MGFQIPEYNWNRFNSMRNTLATSSPWCRWPLHYVYVEALVQIRGGDRQIPHIAENRIKQPDGCGSCNHAI